ncbi:MAG: glycosyltransferase [Thermoplasmata archaeon]|nr:glycosyltransferase [Candidatus Sysuiplasma acidicola]MBX8637218.1 glycosyltransferase [Candidatus Sysuiplasma acidicola]MBX8646027.1 glycosyltransferase [Candidatus Sysuiplasma acidicola]
MLVSVIVTVRNEGRNISDLLESLIRQNVEKEVIIVDAFSTDNTADIVRSYAARYHFIKLYLKSGKRGEGRNFGIQRSTGDIVAFIDGDCNASDHWLEEIVTSLESVDAVAGRTIYVGEGPYSGLERVELYRRGLDVTYPSCNLAYRRTVLTDVGGFDSWFITAEDIDLNIRTVDRGYDLAYNEKAVVHHKTRESLYAFSRQAFWNGAGRKQLTLKYGSLWKSYKPLEMLRRKVTYYGSVRVVMALFGYVAYKLYGQKRKVPF